MGLFEKLKQGLSKTVKAFQYTLNEAFDYLEIGDDFYDELEESLILSDIGAESAEKIIQKLRNVVSQNYLTEPQEVRDALANILAETLSVGDGSLNLSSKPAVILVIGVNGVGKTTSIGKLANQLSSEGRSVLLCAADTFRAAAADQLEIWAERSHVPIIRQHEGADPASVVFDAISAARARKVDVIICDTAGRLHNKQNLMNELAKINKIIDRELPDSSKEVLLVMDATTGQNGLHQAKQFHQFAGITGLILTKLDGTAKGGIVVAVADALHVPVKYIGVGEQIDDLVPFDPKGFAKAMLEEVVS